MSLLDEFNEKNDYRKKSVWWYWGIVFIEMTMIGIASLWITVPLYVIILALILPSLSVFFRNWKADRKFGKIDVGYVTDLDANIVHNPWQSFPMENGDIIVLRRRD